MGFADGVRAGTGHMLAREQYDVLRAERKFRDRAEAASKKYLGEEDQEGPGLFERIGNGVLSFFGVDEKPTAEPAARRTALPTAEAEHGVTPATEPSVNPGAIRQAALPPAYTPSSGIAEPGADYGAAAGMPQAVPREIAEPGADFGAAPTRTAALPTGGNRTVPNSIGWKAEGAAPAGGAGDDAIPTAAPAAAPKSALPKEYQQSIEAAAAKYGVPVSILAGVLHTESAFDPEVISGRKRGGAGEIGIGQFMPGTAKEFGIDPTDAHASIAATAKYLSESKAKFGSWEGAMVAYNRGNGGAAAYQKGGGDFAAEQDYVPKVRKHAKLYGGEGDDAAPTAAPGGAPAAVPKEKYFELTRVPPEKAKETDIVAFNPDTGKQATRQDWEGYSRKMLSAAVATGNPALIQSVERSIGQAMAGGILRNGAYLKQALEAGDAAAVKLYGERLYGYIPDGKRMEVQLGPNKTLQVTQFDEKTGKQVGKQTITAEQLEKMYVGAYNPQVLANIIKGRDDVRQGDERIRQQALDRDENRASRESIAADNRRSREFQAEENRKIRQQTANEAERQHRTTQENKAIELIEADTDFDKMKPSDGHSKPKDAARAVVGDFIKQGVSPGQAHELSKLYARGHLTAHEYTNKAGEKQWRWHRKNFDEKGAEIASTPLPYEVGDNAKAALRMADGQKRALTDKAQKAAEAQKALDEQRKAIDDARTKQDEGRRAIPPPDEVRKRQGVRSFNAEQERRRAIELGQE